VVGRSGTTSPIYCGIGDFDVKPDRTAWLAEYEVMDFTEIHVHHVGTSQRAFIDAFGEHVMPALSHD
jgi:hypothetical protein